MIRIEGLRKSFGRAPDAGAPALDGVGFEVAEGEFFVLVGPSGCGKTTTLRSVAGLENPDAGQIVIDAQTVFDAERGIRLPAELRPTAMVFQSYALWPHMTVYHNIAFPLRRGLRRLPANAVGVRVQEVADLLGLTGMLDRAVTTLSGGQQQRVALARALALRPKVLLMDEPLSNLDAQLRRHLQGELKRLAREVGVTTLYVTHDQQEAMAMGDHVAVLHKGAVLQTSSPREIYESPRHPFVAGFFGESNALAGEVVSAEGGYGVVLTGGTPLEARLAGGLPGVRATVFFHVRDTRLPGGTAPASMENRLRGSVTAVQYRGGSYLCTALVEGGHVSFDAPQEIRPGTPVVLNVDREKCVAFPTP